MGKRDPPYVILLHWNFIVSLNGYCKFFYRILPLFCILLLFYTSFVSIEITKAKSAI